MPTAFPGTEEYVAEAMGAFHANLRFIKSRRVRGLEELAVRSGLTYKNVQMIVSGTQGCNIRTIAKLARAVRVPVGDLFMDPVKFEKRYERAKLLPPLTDAAEARGRKKSAPVTEVSPFCKPQQLVARTGARAVA